MRSSTEAAHSRQREYQKRHLALGLCTHCHSPRIERSKCCFRHDLFYRLAKRGLTKGILSVSASNQREKLTAHLHGRYQALLSGFLQAVDAEQALKDATDIRARLRIRWGGVRGAKKLADIIVSVERHALVAKRGKEAAGDTRGLGNNNSLQTPGV